MKSLHKLFVVLIFTLWMGITPHAFAAISATLLTSGHQSGGSTITTASVTLSTSKSYTMVVGQEVSVNSKNHAVISGWTENGHDSEQSFNNAGFTILSLPVGNGSTGTLTITFGGQTQSFTNYQLIEWSGTDLTAPVVQFNTAHGSASPANTTLSAFADATNNASFFVITHYTGSGTLPTGYTQISNATGDIPLVSSYKIGQDLNPSVANTGAWAVVAQEIKIPAPAGNTTPKLLIQGFLNVLQGFLSL